MCAWVIPAVSDPRPIGLYVDRDVQFGGTVPFMAGRRRSNNRRWSSIIARLISMGIVTAADVSGLAPSGGDMASRFPPVFEYRSSFLRRRRRRSFGRRDEVT